MHIGVSSVSGFMEWVCDIPRTINLAEGDGRYLGEDVSVPLICLVSSVSDFCFFVPTPDDQHGGFLISSSFCSCHQRGSVERNGRDSNIYDCYHAPLCHFASSTHPYIVWCLFPFSLFIIQTFSRFCTSGLARLDWHRLFFYIPCILT